MQDKNRFKTLFSRGKSVLRSSVATCALLAAGLALAASPARAAYPEQPVRIIVAFSAGGTTDILARLVADHMTKEFGKAFVVENKPGAGGNIGTAYVVNAKPDGYTLIIDSVGPIAINPTLTKLPYDPLTDLIAVAEIADVPNVLVVAPEHLKIDNIAELTKQIKSKPGEFNYSSTGVGTSSHLSGYLMGKLQNLDITHIPYKGAEALNDLLAGRVQFMFATIPSVRSLIESGKLKPLAVSSPKRSRSLPDVPTMDEAGFKGFRAGSWFGLFAPKGTPPEIVATLRDSVNRIIQLPDVSKQMVQQGADPMPGSSEQFRDFVKEEHDRWKEVLIESGVVKQ
ncbi:Bug family tripartite tricarboxylate transporter substrate binding protein [Pollutimonas sp. M17]|uniref:Bug family tripartite tricarboxylate transporter substrate binding protein n=1 Tax=Pollutimonas sp. M17 TaxID=2962065 RepID=UPI0021F45004|nr:tripartite tricarboxylate transporter substrate binding protein [Pollutimonas sp. M17]UYO93227.1 tripartite tricarboxylate transporter substrate binding protein [Pollutimonas sp. M17]HWK72351.1 tripartite tricarboxylate transporter substrate binding protein [Burkholderiaceae bacterium]